MGTLLTQSLQLGQDCLASRLLNALAILLFRISDLAMVDYDGIATGAVATEPADALAELDVGV